MCGSQDEGVGVSVCAEPLSRHRETTAKHKGTGAGQIPGSRLGMFLNIPAARGLFVAVFFGYA